MTNVTHKDLLIILLISLLANLVISIGIIKVGPQGPQGLQGPQGNIGLTGPQGPQGPIGLPGSNEYAEPIGWFISEYAEWGGERGYLVRGAIINLATKPLSTLSVRFFWGYPDDMQDGDYGITWGNIEPNETKFVRNLFAFPSQDVNVSHTQSLLIDFQWQIEWEFAE